MLIFSMSGILFHLHPTIRLLSDDVTSNAQFLYAEKDGEVKYRGFFIVPQIVSWEIWGEDHFIVSRFSNDSILYVLLFEQNDDFSLPKICYRSSSLLMVYGALIPFAQSFAKMDMWTTFLLSLKTARRGDSNTGFLFVLVVSVFLFLQMLP